MSKKSLSDIFGPNASDEDRKITARAAQQSMGDMAEVLNAAEKRKRSLSDFFGDDISPEIEEELNNVGDKLAEYLGYVSKFTPSLEKPYPLGVGDYFKQKDA